MAFTVTAGRFDPTYGNYTVYVDPSTGRAEVRIGSAPTWTINNPGAITPGSFATSAGATGVFVNRCPGCTDLAIFPDYATGRAAQAQLLLSSTYNNGDITITNMVKIWAPPETNKLWRRYARNIGDALGVNEDTTTLNQLRQLGKFDQLLDEQQRQEGWYPGTTMKFEGGRLVETVGPDGRITQWDHPLVPSIDSFSHLFTSGSPIALPPVGDLLNLAFDNLMHDIDNTLHLPGASVTPFLIPKNLLQAVYADWRQSLVQQQGTGAYPAPGSSTNVGEGNGPTFTVGNDTITTMYGWGGPSVGVSYQAYASGPDSNRMYIVADYQPNLGIYGNGGLNTPAMLQAWITVAEQVAAQAQGIASPNDQLGGQAVWPGTRDALPATALDAAADSRWGSIAPAVAKQAAAALGLPMPDTGPAPTLLVSLGAGQAPANGGSPFLNGAWAGPGDGLFVWDPSKLRSLVADAPGETVVGFGMDATLDGRPGNDMLWAGPGDNTLLGGPGDVLHGGSGNDIFVGGPNNAMYAGSGSNVFQLTRGFGADTIYATDGGVDTVQFGPNIDPEDVRIVPRGWTNDLVLEIPTSGDRLTLKGWYETLAAGGPQAVVDSFQEHPEWGTRVQQVVFADGTVWDASTLRRKSLVADAQSETIVGFNTDDTLVGRKGHDELWAGAGNDALIGGPADVLHGGSGNDVFVSGENDVIDTGSGTNTLMFHRQDGQDTINAADGTTTVELGSGIKPLDLVFALRPNSTQRNDLQVSVQGRSGDAGPHDDPGGGQGNDDAEPETPAGMTIPNWNALSGTSTGSFPVATFATKDATLAGADVGLLIQAMATFTADTGLSWDQAIERRPHDVEAILAPYWHTTRQ